MLLIWKYACQQNIYAKYLKLLAVCEQIVTWRENETFSVSLHRLYNYTTPTV